MSIKTDKNYQFFVRDCDGCVFRFKASRCMIADNCESFPEGFDFQVMDGNWDEIYDGSPDWCPLKEKDILFSWKE